MRFLAPHPDLAPSYLEAMREHYEVDGRPDADGLDWDDLQDRNWDRYTETLRDGTVPRPGVRYGATSTELWWCTDPTRQEPARYVGRVSIRHHVVRDNRRWGGNLWWSIRPSERGRGLGTQLLMEALPLLAGHGITTPTITVLEGDTARHRVLAKCGAVETGRKVGLVAYRLTPRQARLAGV